MKILAFFQIFNTFFYTMESIWLNFSLLIFIIFYAKFVLCQQAQFSPNVRYHAPQQNASFNYSYINLKHLKGYKLEVTPLATYSVNNRSLCVKECLKTKGACKSINTRQVTNGFDCEILDQDIYTTAGDKLKIENGTTHSLIAVRPCSC